MLYCVQYTWHVKKRERNFPKAGWIVLHHMGDLSFTPALPPKWISSVTFIGPLFFFRESLNIHVSINNTLSIAYFLRNYFFD